MRLVSYNIQYGVGRDGRLDLARAIGAVGGADIIALQEVERNWPKSGMIDQPAEIARLLPDYYWVYGPYFDLDASRPTPDGRIENRRRQHGVMLLARWPIRSSRLFPLPKLDTATGLGFQMGVLEGVIDVPARPLRVYSVHLSALNSLERLPQVDALLHLWRHIAGEGPTWSGEAVLAGTDWSAGELPPPAPVDTVMLGDFNMRPGSPEYRALIADGPERHGRKPQIWSLYDTWLLAGDGGPGATFPPSAAYPLPQGVRIDYGLVSGGLVPAVKQAWVDEAAIGSDHLPYWVEIEG